MSKKSLKKFIGEKAFNVIKNTFVDENKIRKALVTSQNAHNVFENLSDYSIKALCNEICADNSIGIVRPTTQDEIRKVFNSVGYDTVIFDDKKKIAECKKYYKPNETICTYNDLEGRMKNYFMLVAIKKDIDTIERAEYPEREDEYGTSIINIQIAKNGSHMSIKNRYNHTISNPDSTFNNNLNNLCSGLQNKVLGYYGFASLNKPVNNYHNIVKINDVYLKYFEEKNNIYYGAFVLDSTNGVRYADTSRYYICYDFSMPLILDFKEKVCICNNENPYIIFLTTLLKNNILHSGNKEHINELTYFSDNAKNELLQFHSKSLRYVHNNFGYDFNKPHKIFEIFGKITEKSIGKLTSSSNGILFFYYNEYLFCSKYENGKFIVEHKVVSKRFSHITQFCNISNLNDIRKHKMPIVFFIYQDPQYITSPKKEKDDSYYYYNTLYNKYYHESVFDKCGNNLSENYRLLQCRLTNYKKEKRLNEAKQYNFKKDIDSIEFAFKKYKEKLIDTVKNATTRNDFKKLQHMISYDINYVVDDINKLKSHYKNNSFPSVEYVAKTVDNIRSRLKDLETDSIC